MSNATRGRFAAFAETFSHVCTPVAIVVAIIQYGCAANTQLDQRRFEIYNQINDQYLQFLELCVRYDWVDCFDVPNAELIVKYGNVPDAGAQPSAALASSGPRMRRPRDIDPNPLCACEAKTEGAAFAALMSMLERAYVFYKRTLPNADPMVTTQWPGWEKYARSFVRRERFLAHWKDLRDEFDTRFVAWIEGLRKEPLGREDDANRGDRK